MWLVQGQKMEGFDYKGWEIRALLKVAESQKKKKKENQQDFLIRCEG